MKRIYIAGPMQGLPDFNYPEFARVAKAIRNGGNNAVSPHESFGGDTTQPREAYMRLNIQRILTCDSMLMLEGWEKSEGARLEHEIARQLDLPIEYEGAARRDWEDNLDRVVTGSGVVIGTLREDVARLMDDNEALRMKQAFKENMEAGSDTCLGGVEGGCSPDACYCKLNPFDFSGKVDGEGYKASMDDPSKPPMWLVPSALQYAAARALGHGAEKYAPNNWRRGMRWSETYSALQRHLTAWLEGEDFDPASGLNHIDHAAACLGFLSEYVANPDLYGEFDNRFKRPVAERVNYQERG